MMRVLTTRRFAAALLLTAGLFAGGGCGGSGDDGPSAAPTATPLPAGAVVRATPTPYLPATPMAKRTPNPTPTPEDTPPPTPTPDRRFPSEDAAQQALMDSMPDDIPVYEGDRVLESYSDESGTLLDFETYEHPAEMIRKLRRDLKNDGWEFRRTINAGGVVTLRYVKANRIASVQIYRDKNDDPTQVRYIILEEEE